MKILFACGGTGGHINPALAVAQTVRSHYPGTEILFAGSPKGMEARLVPEAGYNFAPIEIQGFMRQPNLRNLRYNVRSVALLARSARRAEKILRDFDPDLVFATGGYVSYPLLRQAAKMGIPTLTHESNAFPGLTTKMLAKDVDKVLIALPEAREYLPEDIETVVTGNPVRDEVLYTDRAVARAALGIPPEAFVLLSFGGSLGARRVNECMADVAAWHITRPELAVCHIHATGSRGVQLFENLMLERGIALPYPAGLDVREYISDMPHCLAAADLVICRAGAITISELQVAGRASILIPSPNVADNHQYHNAKAMQQHGAAVLMEERTLSGKALIEQVEALIGDREQLSALAKAAQRQAIFDAGERIFEEILALVGK